MAKYPRLTNWLERELDDDELQEVFQRFATAIAEQDEGRDIGEWLEIYRAVPQLRDFLDSLMISLTGWSLQTIVTGTTREGETPPEFIDLRYD